ncbi:hypothetical protein Godav_029434, partial [Gossypium davidsonii]|nr:hypothetical protein [Gossypium davidsonii]
VKAVSEAVKAVSSTGGKTIVEATLAVSGKLEMGPTNIAARLTKRRLEVQLMDEWWETPLLPMKNVILSGCRIGREDPAELPSDVRSLRILRCHNIRSLSDLPFFQKTNELGFCSIHDCRGMESVLDLSSQSQSCTPFENLELLRLENLDNLHVLVRVAEASVVSTLSSQSIPAIFSHLKSFHIEGCSNMKQLFPFDLVHDLQNLENLIVRGCGQIEEIIGPKEEEENHKGNGTQAPTKFSLPKLKELELTRLPELKSICSSNREMVCNSLRKIEVWNCTKLKRMPLYLPLFQDTHQSAPSAHPFERIRICPKEWWESVEWDYPNAKEVLRPWLNLY